MESTLNNNIGDLSFSDDLRRRITSNLDRHPTLIQKESSLRRAAVAIAIAPLENGQSGFILTRRGKNLKTHSYQYALPGGKIDDGETQEETVLREVQEDLGDLRRALGGCDRGGRLERGAPGEIRDV